MAGGSRSPAVEGHTFCVLLSVVVAKLSPIPNFDRGYHNYTTAHISLQPPIDELYRSLLKEQLTPELID